MGSGSGSPMACTSTATTSSSGRAGRIHFAAVTRCHLHAAATLFDQGRRGEALSVVARPRPAFAEIGLDAPAPLLALERTIVE